MTDVSAGEVAEGFEDDVVPVVEAVEVAETPEPLTVEKFKQDLSRLKAAWWKPLEIVGATYLQRITRAVDRGLSELEGGDAPKKKN
jgi:hypothetical protein